jgi:hypothetical protein
MQCFSQTLARTTHGTFVPAAHAARQAVHCADRWPCVAFSVANDVDSNAVKRRLPVSSHAAGCDAGESAAQQTDDALFTIYISPRAVGPGRS